MRPIFPLAVLAVVLVAPAAGALGLNLLSAQQTPAAYIIGFEPGQGEDAARLIRVAGGVVGDRADTIGFLVASGLSSSAVTSMLLQPTVTYAEPDKPVSMQGAQWDGSQWNGAQWNGAQWDGAQWNGAQWDGAQWSGAQWGLGAIDAPDAWAQGELPGNANLCVVDSGVERSHPDLAANMHSLSYNAINGTSSSDDYAGHGTHVAGIAAAVRGNQVGGAGVADGEIMSVKVLNRDGRGTVSDLALGMTWCADHGADVALLALSVDGYSRTIERAIDYLEAKNVVVVASAGNNGPCSGCVGYPASDPRVLAVAALDASERHASFSSAGPGVSLAAPGVGITSTFIHGGYATGSGTSQAAAFVAGAALTLRDASPGLPAASVRDALVASARDIGAPGRDDATGAGMLDLGAALRRI